MMASVVVDNSILMPLVFDDEDDSMSRELVIAGASRLQLLCPVLCMMEFGNGIWKGVRQKRMPVERAASAFGELWNLPLHFRDGVAVSALARIGALAVRRGITFYDAVYLDLALTEGASLATLDGPLGDAAAAEGVPLWAWTAK